MTAAAVIGAAAITSAWRERGRGRGRERERERTLEEMGSVSRVKPRTPFLCSGHPTPCPRVSPAGCLCGCSVWMSMGKCSLLRMISWFLPVNLLALLMLLVCQSVQYRLSSNTVMANGCGRPDTHETDEREKRETKDVRVCDWE